MLEVQQARLHDGQADIESGRLDIVRHQLRPLSAICNLRRAPGHEGPGHGHPSLSALQDATRLHQLLELDCHQLEEVLTKFECSKNSDRWPRTGFILIIAYFALLPFPKTLSADMILYSSTVVKSLYKHVRRSYLEMFECS